MVAHAPREKPKNLDRIRAIIDVIGMIERWAPMVEDGGDTGKARELRKLADELKFRVQSIAKVRGVTPSMVVRAAVEQQAGDIK